MGYLDYIEVQKHNLIRVNLMEMWLDTLMPVLTANEFETRII